MDYSERLHKCAKCVKQFNRAEHLRNHIKQIHDKIKDVKCIYCDVLFYTKTHMKAHVKQIHEKIKDII